MPDQLPTDPTIEAAMINALHKVLAYPNDAGEGTLLLQRVPLICKDIREIRDMLETQLAAVEPLLKEYKERVAAGAYATRWGDRAKWTAGVGTALGVLWLAAVSLIHFIQGK